MPAPKDIEIYENPFGHALRRHRERLGLTQAHLSERLGYSADLISKVETGAAGASEVFARDCDTMFHTHGMMEYLALLARRVAGFPRWFRWWAEEIEPKAHTLRSWQPLVVDGLLQTADYARELLKTHPGMSEGRVDQLVTARMERQEILDREAAPVLWFLVAENVLRYEIGNTKVMREQLQHLVEMSHHSHVNVQVLPTSAGAHPGLNGGLAIASLNGESTMVYLENARAGQVIDRSEDVQAIMNIWEAIRLEALPAGASLDVIARVMEQWT